MTTRSRSRVLGLLLAATAAATAVVYAASQPAGAATETLTAAATYTFVVGELGDPGDNLVLDVGHTDAVAPTLENGDLVLKTKDDTGLHGAGVTYRDPADLILQVLPSAEIAVPDLPEYAFLGDGGDPVWLLPMTQDPSLLWPGWSTEHPSLHLQFDSIEFEVTDVVGPGEFHLFLNDPFGGPIHRANSVGTLSNTWSENIGAHVHANWAFTAPGTYEITFQVTADWLNAPDPDPTETVLSISGMDDCYVVGATGTLTAAQDPATGFDDHQWFLHFGPGDDYPIDGATTSSYTFSAVASDDGVALLVRLYDDEGGLLAESDPVTINIEESCEPDPDPDPALSQTITATLEEPEGALVVSIDPEDREVVMSPFELSGDGNRWESSGELGPIRVTDTRSSEPGWSVSGQAGTFASSGSTFGSRHLGWTPEVAGQDEGQGVTAGSSVAPGAAAGDGLETSRPLAGAPDGAGRGTATLGGGLALQVPTATAPGTYTAILTITVV